MANGEWRMANGTGRSAPAQVFMVHDGDAQTLSIHAVAPRLRSPFAICHLPFAIPSVATPTNISTHPDRTP
jgi:hypothetical protein